MKARRVGSQAQAARAAGANRAASATVQGGTVGVLRPVCVYQEDLHHVAGSKGSMKKTNALFSYKSRQEIRVRLCPAWGIVVFCQKSHREEEQQALQSDAHLPRGGFTRHLTQLSPILHQIKFNSTEGEMAI